MVVTVTVPPPQPTQNNDTTQQQEPQPTAIAHEPKWYQADAAIKLPTRENYHHRSWAIETRIGEWIGKGGDLQYTHSFLDYFSMMFPPSQLNLIVDLMNGESLEKY